MVFAERHNRPEKKCKCSGSAKSSFLVVKIMEILVNLPLRKRLNHGISRIDHAQDGREYHGGNYPHVAEKARR